VSLHGRHSAKDTAQISPPAAAAARPDEDQPPGDGLPAGRPPEEKAPKRKEESSLGFLRELPVLVLIAFLIAIIIKTFVVQAFYIPSESMQNTLLVNDRVLVSKFIYKFKDPRPGDIVVFVAPPAATGSLPQAPTGIAGFFNSLKEGLGLPSSQRDFIKRVVAVGGDTVQVKDSALYVNNVRKDEPYLKDHNPATMGMGDYGPTNLDNRHGFTAGGNWDVWRGLGIGGTFMYYTGTPVNELVGDDANNDLDSFDRPAKGRNDATLPILSKVAANGYAIHNTMPGRSDYLTLNLRVQYELPLDVASRRLGFYWELYNLTNRNNFSNPFNDRTSTLFNELTSVGAPRTMQLGLRYSF